MSQERPTYANNSQTVVVDADTFEFETLEEIERPRDRRALQRREPGRAPRRRAARALGQRHTLPRHDRHDRGRPRRRHRPPRLAPPRHSAVAARVCDLGRGCPLLFLRLSILAKMLTTARGGIRLPRKVAASPAPVTCPTFHQGAPPAKDIDDCAMRGHTFFVPAELIERRERRRPASLGRVSLYARATAGNLVTLGRRHASRRL